MPIGACANVAVPEVTEKMMSYYHSGNLLWILGWVFSLIVPLLFLFTGFSGGLGKFADKFGKKWFFAIAIYLVLFIVIYQLLNLPLDFYSSYVREHKYALSEQSLGRWVENYGKMSLVFTMGAVAFVWIFYLLLKKSPRRWWFYSGLAGIGIAFIVDFVQPIWIDPFFNKFGPMKDKQLEQKILRLAKRAGIEHSRIFEVDMSQDTKKGNAYVVGFGSTARIVFWDTILNQANTDEILFVTGHEMGHYVLHHNWWSLASFGFFSFIILYLTYRSATFLLLRYKTQFGFKHLHNIASFPLFLFLISGYIFLFTPFTNYISRLMEHEADRFGLEITQNNEAAGEMFAAFALDNLKNPRPGILYKIWRSDHPPLGERIDFSNCYCPWKQGKPLKYAKYFK